MANDMAVVDDLRPDLDAAEQLALPPSAFPFAPLKALAQEGALTAVGLDLTLGEELTFRGYEKLGFYLGLMNRSCMWWIGDWLLYGEGRYGERFSQALSVTGLAEQTLLNRMSVCRAIPIPERKAALSFSVHAELAPLDSRDRAYWLDRAEANGWNRTQLRDEMKAAKEGDHPQLDAGEDDQTLKPVASLVIEAAHAVVSAKQDYGADWLVPREPMARLMSAIGEEDLMVTPAAQRRLIRARNLIAQGDQKYHDAVEEIQAAISEGASYNDYARVIGRSGTWVRSIVDWATDPDAADTPFAADTPRRNRDALRRALREAPVEDVEEAIQELPRERQRIVAQTATRVEERNRTPMPRRTTPEPTIRGASWVSANGRLSRVKQELRLAIDVARTAEFSTEEVELLEQDIAQIRAMIGLMEMAVTGSSGVDWDAELAGLTTT